MFMVGRIFNRSVGNLKPTFYFVWPYEVPASDDTLYIIYQVSKFINSSILWLKDDDVKSRNSTVDCMRSARALKVLMPAY